MSQRSIICEQSVTFSYPGELEVKISRNVYPDDPDEPGCTVFSVEVGNGAAQAMFATIRDLERYHKAIGYFLDQIDKEGGER